MVILGLDPGETTGTTIFEIPKEVKTIPVTGNMQQYMKYSGELKTWEEIQNVKDQYKPDIIVFEEFRLYAEKAQSKTRSDFPEVKIIGQIELIASISNIPTFKQNASIVKNFYTDDKLKALNLWIRGNKHARDAIRHVLYFYDFNRHKVELFRGG